MPACQTLDRFLRFCIGHTDQPDVFGIVVKQITAQRPVAAQRITAAAQEDEARERGIVIACGLHEPERGLDLAPSAPIDAHAIAGQCDAARVGKFMTKKSDIGLGIDMHENMRPGRRERAHETPKQHWLGMCGNEKGDFGRWETRLRGGAGGTEHANTPRCDVIARTNIGRGVFPSCLSVISLPGRNHASTDRSLSATSGMSAK